jgi:hypothetical protein
MEGGAMDFVGFLSNSTKAAEFAQIISASAVVISIIYLGRQLRQNTRSVKAQTFIAVLANNISVMGSIYLNPDFAKLVNTASNDLSPLSPEDNLRWNAYMRTMFRQLDNVYHQYLTGTLDEDVWPGYEQILTHWLKMPGSFRWFEQNLHFFSASLQDYYSKNIRPQLLRDAPEQSLLDAAS